MQKKGIHHCIQLRHGAERVVVLSRNNLLILDTCLEFQVDLRHEVPLQHQELATRSCAIGATSNSESGFAQGWSTICTALSSVKTRLSSTIRCTKKRCPFVQTPTEADLESKRLLRVKQEQGAPDLQRLSCNACLCVNRFYLMFLLTMETSTFAART